MKKYLLLMLALLLVLTGCSSGISQADYDAMLAERNAALEENQALKEKLAAYDTNWEAEETASVTEPALETEPREDNIAELLDIEIVEWCTASGYSPCNLIVTNNSQQIVRAKFAIKYFDISGNVVGISNVSTEALGPGASHLISASNEFPYEYSEVSIISANADDYFIGSMEDVTCNDYAVNGKKVIFEVTNNGDAAVEFIQAARGLCIRMQQSCQRAGI